MDFRSRVLSGSLGLLAFAACGVASAATPTVDDALKLAPIQKDVEYDKPASGEGCTMKAEKSGDVSGWVVRDANGRILRRFSDTNGDDTVDQWSYYRDGVEVYRDIDANFNAKADQYRWMNLGGTRWGIDENEDKKIDFWKAITAEEVSAEIVWALADRDSARFNRVLLSNQELAALGVGEEKNKTLAAKIEAAATTFKTLAARQKSITADTTWIDFGGSQPGLVPAGSDGSTLDLLVYEHSMAMIQTDDKHGQLRIGTLVKVGDGWRVIDVPALEGEETADLGNNSFFIPTAMANRIDAGHAGGGGPDGKTQELLAKLEKLDQSAAAATPELQNKLNDERADLLEEIAASVGTPAERSQWIRQLADTMSAAVQSGAYPEGVERLQKLCDSLKADGKDQELAAYVQFRYMTANYGLSLQSEKANFSEIQTTWLSDLRDYVKNHPQSPDTAEAMLQLGIAQEFSGQEDDAKDWYGKIVSNFPESPSAKKAAGAVRRLDCVGQVMQLRGASPNGKSVDLAAQYKGKIVLVQYWATWCEPALAQLPEIKNLQAKYAKSGFQIVGVSLDSSPDELTNYLKQNRLPWAQVYEPGGLDSRLANEMGILTLPTMLLIDQNGKVVNRNVEITELDKQIKALIK